jgi:hypothetical protein
LNEFARRHFPVAGRPPPISGSLDVYKPKGIIFSPIQRICKEKDGLRMLESARRGVGFRFQTAGLAQRAPRSETRIVNFETVLPASIPRCGYTALSCSAGGKVNELPLFFKRNALW